MSHYYLVFDLKINVGHCDLYFMFQWICLFIEVKWFCFLLFFVLKNILILLARCNSGKLCCAATALIFSGFCNFLFPFLAHLSRRLTRWAYSIPMVRPSVRPSVRRRPSSSSVVVHSFKLEYLWSQSANLDQILCVASLGWGKGCIRFWGRLDQNSGFHGNRKPPLTYNGENDISTFFWLFLIRSFLYLQVTRTCIKSRMSSNFGHYGRLTTELAALECLKNFP